jgi:hypothetical protein
MIDRVLSIYNNACRALAAGGTERVVAGAIELDGEAAS